MGRVDSGRLAWAGRSEESLSLSSIRLETNSATPGPPRSLLDDVRRLGHKEGHLGVFLLARSGKGNFSLLLTVALGCCSIQGWGLLDQGQGNGQERIQNFAAQVIGIIYLTPRMEGDLGHLSTFFRSLIRQAIRLSVDWVKS